MKHIVKLTVSNPSHDFISMRSRIKQQDYITEARDESEAINRAARHFRTLGFKVHSAVIVEQKVELPEPVALAEAVDYNALKKPTIARIKSGETKPVDRTDYNVPPGMRKKPIDKKAALEAFIARRKETVTEEAAPQYIEEKLTAADPASKWIHDFVHSDNPKFAGKSKEERIQQALGAYYASKRHAGGMAEEVEQVEEGLGDIIKNAKGGIKKAQVNWQSTHRATYGADPTKTSMAISAIARLAGINAGKARGLGSLLAGKQVTKQQKQAAANRVGKLAINKMRKEDVEQVEEGTFKYHVDKAIAAHERGDDKKKEYHLDNAKTARYAMPTKDYAKNKDLLDKYKSMSEEVEQTDEAIRVTMYGKELPPKSKRKAAGGKPTKSDELRNAFATAAKEKRSMFGGGMAGMNSPLNFKPIKQITTAAVGAKKTNEEVEQIDEKTHLEYTGKVNDNDYRLLVPHNKDLGDYSDEQLHRKLRRENPHLAHHEVTAIVHSYGDPETDVDVEHKGKKYTHHVVNDQEPNYIREEVEQIDESRVVVGPENHDSATNTVWHIVHHKGREIGTIGTIQKKHQENHGKWGFEDSRGYHRRVNEPLLNSKEDAVAALRNRHAEYLKNKKNSVKEEVEQIDEDIKVGDKVKVNDPGKVFHGYTVKVKKDNGDGTYHVDSSWNQFGRSVHKSKLEKVPKQMKFNFKEEVEQTDEARKMSRIEWRTGTSGDVAKNHQKIYKKLSSTDPEKAERFLKSVKGMKKEVQANEAADPGETKVVNKAVKTKKASAAADRIVKIAKSKANKDKVNMDPELNHDVKQSSRY